MMSDALLELGSKAFNSNKVLLDSKGARGLPLCICASPAHARTTTAWLYLNLQLHRLRFATRHVSKAPSPMRFSESGMVK